ncbi:hypothetical protein ACFWFQ_31745 [Nocardia salmonicida]|uniref:hypothetical protein n=1 Tax=Nocardia salmonicida TaxID=53431 RepID=UPI003659C843
MTKAEKGGDAGKIAAARQRETDAYREFDWLANGSSNRCRNYDAVCVWAEYLSDGMCCRLP